MKKITTLRINCIRVHYYLIVTYPTAKSVELMNKMKISYDIKDNPIQSSPLSTEEYINLSMTDAKNLVKLLDTAEIKYEMSDTLKRILSD